MAITFDSRKVKKGDIFVAIKGVHFDGNDFIAEALAKGASKVISGKDAREKLGELAAEYYGNPSRKIKVIGVTGTKGKTTTCHLIYHILNSLGFNTGLISSITTQGFHTTTPDVLVLNEELSKMVKEGKKYAVIEVSSHGIDQGRIAGINFEVGVLTNIAPEHLDYHKSFKEYKKVKMSFVNSAKYKVTSPPDTDIDILPGKFNNLNVEAALEAVERLGIDRKSALKSVKSFKLPEGRLEEVKNSSGFRVFIDFAHTPDSLEAALTHLRTITDGKLISVFGCAAERDVRKRRKMGKISGDLADLSVFTVEDSRFENISEIFRSMKKDSKNYVCIPERGEAIAYALGIAKKGDVIGIFGKGHEKSLSYKGFEHLWSDKQAVEDFLKRDRGTSAMILAAGRGTRMRTSYPKVLHEICGRPMIAYTLQNLRKARVGEIVAILGYRKNLIIEKIKGAVKVAVQEKPKGGTADAVVSGLPHIAIESDTIVVMYGDDTAFYTPKTIDKVLEKHKKEKSKLTFVSLIKNDPHGLGRIVRDSKGNLMGIVEEKDASDNERKIKEINDGLYVFDRDWLETNISKVKISPITGEYYLVELIKIAIDQKQKVGAFTLPDDSEWQGINTPEELQKAEAKMKLKLLS